MARDGAHKLSMQKIRKMSMSEELGYTDNNNPFGDNTMSQKFVWKKKNEFLAAAGQYQAPTRDGEIKKHREKLQEIKNVKKRRTEREKEQDLLEKQREERAREEAQEQYDEWVSTAEEFHLAQAKMRSSIRIQQGRERPMDLVDKALQIVDGETFDDMTVLDKAPYRILYGLSKLQLQESKDEIRNFMLNDTRHKQFWKAMLTVCDDALAKVQTSSMPTRAKRDDGIPQTVADDVEELLGTQAPEEMLKLEEQIARSLERGGDGVDTQFFEAVQKRLPLYKARAQIDAIHQTAYGKMQEWQASIHRKKRKEADAAAPDEGISAWDGEVPGVGPPANADDPEDYSPVLDPFSDDEAGPAEAGACSPALHDPGDEELVGETCADPAEDEERRRRLRAKLKEMHGGSESSIPQQAADRMVEDAKRKGLAEDEHVLRGEEILAARRYEWEDKYKPRKPRFFNRVRTGYQWTKYNQAHYDHDNPPPKVVQGYKFNIFYPDLIDKTRCPTYSLEKADAADQILIRFRAGPPYEDVAFKIVNKEW
eukprot:CAMPEP_0204321652 /NCGR_PEP_ID=MMETSP0469-20131031/8278_1 /ASSEMBLY_ACC=CAM_ASM_000384 /TAXON_ID=2969 /ORGANISM="Oxyrrhis marina" /LENGTH=537 /DNA_ID=CAMNT_0051302969 /DNA_START=19 /DNA_END=1629 /DNA_ORIENTATION=-